LGNSWSLPWKFSAQSISTGRSGPPLSIGDGQAISRGNRQDISQGNMSPDLSGGAILSSSCGNIPGQRWALSEKFLWLNNVYFWKKFDQWYFVYVPFFIIHEFYGTGPFFPGLYFLITTVNSQWIFKILS
jgi:hypothetical protein